ncbi:glycosyltransferase [Microbacterium sp.]|uniref:glycosyltransferase n=1 Tax=Microbacterium sp. TaxID=51671 RepID=UPI0039E36084
MARFFVTAMPFTGHVVPVLAVAGALVARGHDVRVYTGSAFRARVEATGARFVPWQAAPDFDEQNLPASFPRLVGKKGFAQLLINMEDLFIATAPQQLTDAHAEWLRDPWDVLVGDEASLGPRLIADALGCRWATIAVLPLQLVGPHGPPPGLGFRPGHTAVTRARDAALRALVPALERPLTRAARRARLAAGLAPGDEGFSTMVWSRRLILASGVAALDFDRTDRPEHLHWVGRLTAPAASTPPELPPWWSDLDGRRVIHVTQGTQNVDPEDLLRPALEALSDVDALIVATTGVRGVDELPFPVPRNARVASFVPYEQLLPRCDLVVTNGGWGGVLATLAHGVPIVAGGGDLDKPESAARVAGSGAGINLRTGTPSAKAVREAVDRVSADAGYRSAAQRVAVALAAAGGAPRAAALLEEFAA